jgi:hypothetical protein
MTRRPPRLPSRPLLRLGWLACLLAVSAWACRYSVRDTGFVDLGLESYRLRWVPDPALPADAVATVRDRASGLLRESNLTWDDGVSAGTAPAGPGLTLRDAGDRPLGLPIGSPADAGAILRAIEAAATSPLRETLYRECLGAYAVVLLVEGADVAANRRVARDADAAIAAITRLLPTLPKPVDSPPRAIPVSRERQRAEAILLWGLGMDPAPADAPRVAIVYGRGRRLGAPLEGPLITQTALRDRLLLIGQDCECDLDRAWLRGPLLPGRWDRGLQQAALGALGFDPGNPMVRAEISRIVERGPQNAGRRRPPSAGTSLGYSEESVEAPESVGTDGAEVADRADVAGPVAGASPSTPSTTSGSTSGPSTPKPAPGAEEVPGAGRGIWLALGGVAAVVLASGLGLWFRAARR